MYLLQLVQALKYENFNDILGGLEPGSKKDSQGLGESIVMGDMDRSGAPLHLSHLHKIRRQAPWS